MSRSTSQLAAALLEGQEVTLVKDVEETDPYERLLRYVYLGEEMANARAKVPSCLAADNLGCRHGERALLIRGRARDREGALVEHLLHELVTVVMADASEAEVQKALKRNFESLAKKLKP